MWSGQLWLSIKWRKLLVSTALGYCFFKIYFSGNTELQKFKRATVVSGYFSSLVFTLSVSFNPPNPKITRLEQQVTHLLKQWFACAGFGDGRDAQDSSVKRRLRSPRFKESPPPPKIQFRGPNITSNYWKRRSFCSLPPKPALECLQRF